MSSQPRREAEALDPAESVRPEARAHAPREIIEGLARAEAIEEPIARAWGLAVAEMGPPMSDKERADRAEAALLALGPIGAQAFAAAMGRR